MERVIFNIPILHFPKIFKKPDKYFRIVLLDLKDPNEIRKIGNKDLKKLREILCYADIVSNFPCKYKILVVRKYRFLTHESLKNSVDTVNSIMSSITSKEFIREELPKDLSRWLNLLI